MQSRVPSAPWGGADSPAREVALGRTGRTAVVCGPGPDGADGPLASKARLANGQPSATAHQRSWRTAVRSGS